MARYRASDENATSETPCSWPTNSSRGDLSVVDHVRAVLSADEVAISLPSPLDTQHDQIWGNHSSF